MCETGSDNPNNKRKFKNMNYHIKQKYIFHIYDIKYRHEKHELPTIFN